MVTEDYVSFETAKLLKEKGFDEPCIRHWECDSQFLYGANDIPISNSDLQANEYYEFSAPTFQMAMKWLREKHNIHITIDCDICDSFDFYSIIRIKSEESWKTYVEYEDEGSNTYEEAIEKAVEYCLTNLI